MEKKKITEKQQLATGFACSSRTVSPGKHCYRIICASYTQFHVQLGMQAFQLPQTASKQGSVNDAADVACLPLLLLQQSGYWGRSLSGHKIFQPVSRMLILEIPNAVVAVPADVTSHSCHCPPHIFYAPDSFFDIFHMTCWDVQLLSTWEHHSWVWHGKEPLSQKATNWRLEALTKNWFHKAQ